MRTYSLTWLGLAVLALPACGPTGPSSLEGFGEIGETGDGDGDPGDGDGDGDGECLVDANLGSQTNLFFEDLLSEQQGNELPSFCTEQSIADYVLSWTAPQSGLFRVSLTADFWGSVTVLRGDCEGSFETCAAFELPSVADFEAIGGQQYTFVVEGESSGWFWLELFPIDVEPGTCPDGHLFGLQDTVFGSTFDGGFDFGSECGGHDSPDRAYLFFPEQDGVYRFDTVGSGFDTVLHVFEGECTSSPTLVCNDDSFESLESLVEVPMFAGQVYTVVVDGCCGNQGEFQLNYELVGGPQDVCEDIVSLPSELPAVASWSVEDSSDNVFQQCSFASFERRFLWVPPEDGLYRVLQSAGSNNFSAVALLHDGCTGNALSCATPGQNNQVDLVFDAAAGQEIVIVSEWEVFEPGEVSLVIDKFDANVGCGENIGNEVPLVAGGQTTDAGDDFEGSCSVNPAPEVELHWTAPVTATYQFSLHNSDYDTLMYIRDGGCEGPELGCSDDTITQNGLQLWSQLELPLVAGQTVSIFIDGFSGGGDFSLDITQL